MNVEPIRLETPLRREDVEPLKCGDVVRLHGVLYAARDAAHARMKEAVERGELLPFDPEGQVVYYTGPAPARPGRALGPAGHGRRVTALAVHGESFPTPIAACPVSVNLDCHAHRTSSIEL